jgi:hypothetical protein
VLRKRISANRSREAPTKTLEGSFGCRHRPITAAVDGRRNAPSGDFCYGQNSDMTERLVIRGKLRSGYGEVLTPAGVAFIAELEHKFGPERRRLLAS